jgi:two-component system NtrC family response regulator
MTKLDILIAEDESSQRGMLSGFLAKEGHRVVVASNGEEALAQVKVHTLDLAIVDYKMPGLTGLEVLKKAKSLYPQLDIVILTAFGTIDTAVEAMKAGATDYLSKPVDLEELLCVIDRIAEHPTLQRENELLRQQLAEKGISQEQIVHGSR